MIRLGSLLIWGPEKILGIGENVSSTLRTVEFNEEYEYSGVANRSCMII